MERIASLGKHFGHRQIGNGRSHPKILGLPLSFCVETAVSFVSTKL
ncbi:MAG: hypothetical protein M5U34_21390 [Chloroflexi bacterium]|nr:hypothetical protein [Chloroflexota bacterium]